MSLLGKSFKFTKSAFDGSALRGLLGGGGDSSQGAILAELQAAKERARVATLGAQATQRSALPMVAKAFDATRGNLAQGAERSKRLVARQTMGQLDSLGPGTSSLSIFQQRGLRDDLARANQEIDARLAESLGPIAGQQAGLTAGILGQDARFGLQGAGMQNDASFALAQALARPKRRKKGVLDILGAAAPIFGSLAGGPPGAMAGNALASGLGSYNGSDQYENDTGL